MENQKLCMYFISQSATKSPNPVDEEVRYKIHCLYTKPDVYSYSHGYMANIHTIALTLALNQEKSSIVIFHLATHPRR